MNATDEEWAMFTPEDIDNYFQEYYGVVPIREKGQGLLPPVLAFRENNELGLPAPDIVDQECDAAAVMQYCRSHPEPFLYARECVKRLLWKIRVGEMRNKPAVFLGCTTYIAPTFGITTRHNLSDVGEQVQITSSASLCMFFG